MTFIVCGAVLLLGTIGCEKALFPKDAPRSPYERYQTLRGQDRPMTETNVWGGEQPSLRNRLKPLDEP
ncbi:MAG: hypothetical protein IT440_07755 [Phycisphaeraceae bacterium]|nr:hypothetical protein [Phycisphaeraceae bacterium]